VVQAVVANSQGLGELVEVEYLGAIRLHQELTQGRRLVLDKEK
jgi:hypothetical protein